MAESGATKRAMADALKVLMQEHPLSGITVGDVCGQCRMNRKSFYYHFRDKYDLVTWVFRTDFFDAYLPNEDAAVSRDTLLCLCRFLAANKSFYRAALKVDGQNSFHEYLSDVLRPILAERMPSSMRQDEHADFFLDLYTALFRERITSWVMNGCAMPADQFIALMYRAGASLDTLGRLPSANSPQH